MVADAADHGCLACVFYVPGRAFEGEDSKVISKIVLYLMHSLCYHQCVPGGLYQ